MGHFRSSLFTLNRNLQYRHNMAAAMTSTFLGASMVKTAVRTTAAQRTGLVVKADLYPEGLPNLPGSSPYDSDFSETLWPNWSDGKSSEEITKLCENELIHGRWAMMGCAGMSAGFAELIEASFPTYRTLLSNVNLSMRVFSEFWTTSRNPNSSSWKS